MQHFIPICRYNYCTCTYSHSRPELAKEVFSARRSLAGNVMIQKPVGTYLIVSLTKKSKD